MKSHYIKHWFSDFWKVFIHELKTVFSDGGFLIIFFVAGLGYPLLYGYIYSNGIVEDTPVAVVDLADCSESRKFIREIDATRELSVAYRCQDMTEAQELFAARKVNGIMYFPSDYGDKRAHEETAKLSIYADMSCFLYYKNLLLGSENVMLHHMNNDAITYTENLPYNRTFSYSIFFLSAVLMLIIQQVMFYGTTMLAGTAREENRSFATLPASLHGHGVSRVIFGRGLVYWLLFMAIGIYIATIVPAVIGLPQRGDYWDIMLMLVIFVLDCVVFSQFWSSFINKRETVFVLLLFISPICLFLTGFSWPSSAIPPFWKAFSWLFPSTFGCQAFINLNTAGSTIASVRPLLHAMITQLAIYYALSCVAMYVEQQVIKRNA